ncbi:hypothetical protein LTR50_002831 [Elasticomyces elasticus]|nr:hypothetical protein LTR50_002831 [Elasticomyces elasticus]
MASIASPRPSISLSSRRGSTDTTRSASITPHPQHQRRNRAALRDYYGLKNAAPADDTHDAKNAVVEQAEESELDRAGFDSEKYVQELLGREGLEGVLRAEASLLSEIRGLDGERKALVYDNYSKLIAATDTIRKMRTNMDPLTPATSTLAPAISHIAVTATSLSRSLSERILSTSIINIPEGTESSGEAQTAEQQQKATVRWALAAPDHLRKLCSEDRRQDAETEWNEITALLAHWHDVPGVEKVKADCEEAMKTQKPP